MSKKVEIPIDVFKVFIRFNFPVTQSMVAAIADQRNNKVLLLPCDTDVIIVDNKGKVTKY
mgnify:CR=1 FL=1